MMLPICTAGARSTAGVSQEIRQKLTGHASAEKNTRYTHHGLETLCAAVAVIPRINSRA
jgi:hypothetical protein